MQYAKPDPVHCSVHCSRETEIERLPGLDAALDRFEAVYRDLNGLIGRTEVQASAGSE